MATAPQRETQKKTQSRKRRSGAVLTLRLNRPDKLNALTTPMCRALLHSLLVAADDKSVRAIVITGAGRAFCAGGDLE